MALAVESRCKPYRYKSGSAPSRRITSACTARAASPTQRLSAINEDDVLLLHTCASREHWNVKILNSS